MVRDWQSQELERVEMTRVKRHRASVSMAERLRFTASTSHRNGIQEEIILDCEVLLEKVGNVQCQIANLSYLMEQYKESSITQSLQSSYSLRQP